MNSPHEIAGLLSGLRALAARDYEGGGALATVLRTRGSTFRRPGATMLVLGDGQVVRALTGGCPQRDIVTRAQRVIETGSAEIVRYSREQGFDTLLEMGCTGELDVLIEPIGSAADLAFAECIESCLARRAPTLVATVFARDGECLTPRPLRRIWSTDRAEPSLDELPDAAVDPEFTVALNAALAGVAGLHGGQSRVLALQTTAGSIEVLIERTQPQRVLAVIGINSGACAVATLADQMGWITTLVDPAPLSPDRALDIPDDLPASIRVIHATPERLADQLPMDANTAILVMSHNVERDIDYLRAVTGWPLGYVGAIGSRERARRLREASGLGERLNAPAGLDIGSSTTEEIAVAIVAEILAVAAGRNGSPLATVSGPIHP